MHHGSRARRRLIPFCAVVALAACGSSAASTTGSGSAASSSSSAAGTASCGPAGARKLAAGTRARVYSVGKAVSACVTGSAKSVRLGSSGSCLQATKVGPFAVAGTLVALASERCGVDMGSTLVVVKRLPLGQTLFSHIALASPGPESYTSVGSIVVTGKGRVAWIAHGASIVAHQDVSEVEVQSGQGVRVLDHGSGIRLGSLRVSAGRLTWGDGTGQRSAQIG